MTHYVEYLQGCLLCTNETIVSMSMYLPYDRKYRLSYGLCEDCVGKKSVLEDTEKIAKELLWRIEKAANARNN